MKTYLAAMLLVTFGFRLATAVGQEATANLLTTNSPFVLYMQNPPWIKEMRYVQSVYCRAGSEPGKIDKEKWIDDTNRFAVQPSGMFYEMLTGNPFGPSRRSDDKAIVGSFKHYDWIGDLNRTSGGLPTLSLGSKLVEEGASTNNHSTFRVEQCLQLIGWIRYLGLPPLQTNSFELFDNNQFSAQTIDGYELDGNVLAASNNHPLALTYTINGGDVFSIKYKYKPDKNLPSYLERRELRNGRAFGDPITNWIEYAEYGTDAAITDGYKPSYFFTNLTVFTQLLVESNGQRYVIRQGNKRELINDAAFHSLPTDKGENNIFLIIVVFLFLTAGGLFIWRVKQRS